MSENLDLVRSIYADWERGDYSRVDWADPDIEFAWIDGLSPGRWSGLRGMSEGMREMLTAWKDHRVIAEEFTEVDAERVLVTVRAEARGRTSGIEAKDVLSTRRGADVFRIRSGQVTRIHAYWDRDHALADLGLEE
jgi:ketosteroid isomerase-like protein